MANAVREIHACPRLHSDLINKIVSTANILGVTSESTKEIIKLEKEWATTLINVFNSIDQLAKSTSLNIEQSCMVGMDIVISCEGIGNMTITVVKEQNGDGTDGEWIKNAYPNLYATFDGGIYSGVGENLVELKIRELVHMLATAQCRRPQATKAVIYSFANDEVELSDVITQLNEAFGRPSAQGGGRIVYTSKRPRVVPRQGIV